MTTFTVANITDVLTNANWSFDASNFLIGQPGVGIVIGEVTPTDETNSVNVSGGYYINNVSISTTFATGTLSASNGLVVTGKGVELGAPTGGQPATAGQINGTAYLQNNVNIVTGKANHSTFSNTPTGTISTSFVMMGIAGSITPTLTGNVVLFASGTIANSAGSSFASLIMAYGTGGAPSNGAAATGTTAGSNEVGEAPLVPFCVMAIVTGLTVGTAYWLDLQLKSSSGSNTASITSVTIGGWEI